MNSSKNKPHDGDGKYINIRGLRINNLKNIDLDIPRNKLIVVTGVSGSGKSSLAFDTLYAEGQRRYVESLSSYARQFLGRMSKPEADLIKGIPPAVAIEQRVITRNPRSIVATSSEIYEYLRLLYARVGRIISPYTGNEIKKHNSLDVIKYIKSQKENSTVYISAKINTPQGRSIEEHLRLQISLGYLRLLANNKVIRIEDYLNDNRIDDDIYLLYDRVQVNKDIEEIQNRLVDSIETAFLESEGECYVFVEENKGDKLKLTIFSNKLEENGINYTELSPNLFSFNNPLGACPTCEGFGKVVGIDPKLVIPDESLSIYDDAVVAWRSKSASEWKKAFIEAAKYFPIHKPYEDLSETDKSILWEGAYSERYKEYIGINPYFRYLEKESYKIQNRVRLSQFKGKTICPECNGSRLKKDALIVKVASRSIDEILKMSLKEALEHFQNISLSKEELYIADRLLKEIKNRLELLIDVGLSYITLDRPMSTLSGGESQRIALSTQIGSSLIGSMYVLDEPSIGLHQRDTQRLISVVRKLRDLGNTVVVVEHDEEMMRAADYIIDIGPMAGSQGGELIYAGDYKSIDKNTKGLTAAYLNHTLHIDVPKYRRKWRDYVEIKGIKANNLKNLDIKVPLSAMTVIAGVSGSGKSTFMKEVFVPAVKKILYNEEEIDANTYKSAFISRNNIYNIEYVDQNSLSKSSRSNPAIYIGAFEGIRNLYSSLPESKQMGYKPYYFSFNKEGGRCERCLGEGYVNIEMQFMADIKILCDDCNGKRFTKDILMVEYCGKNINDILEMTIDEAIDFFVQNNSEQYKKIIDTIIKSLSSLQLVGLGYIKMGQSTSTLSGGENQRLKLATYINMEKSIDNTIYVFDEPTTGLHFNDIKTLLKAFDKLMEHGASIIIIEHNLDVIKSADWVIELGPEGGDNGGYLVAEGTPEQIVENKKSITGKYLSHYLH